jgi:hypothetical protein
MTAFTLKCAICGRPVSLEECKVDAVGMAVHEECYVSKLANGKKAGNQTRPLGNKEA